MSVRPRAGESETQRIDAFPSSPSERRGEVRVPSSIPAAIDGQRDFSNTALLYNASRSGALLTTQRSWELEQLLELKLHLDSPIDGILVSARVVRVSHRDDPYWKFEVGVCFDAPLPDELLTRIEEKGKSRPPPAP
jgi:hypothetical protein